ncbi:hypothetical protein ANTQUA_LOCUS4102 [Anthophora quadrimaculata]
MIARVEELEPAELIDRYRNETKDRYPDIIDTLSILKINDRESAARLGKTTSIPGDLIAREAIIFRLAESQTTCPSVESHIEGDSDRMAQ